MKNPGSEQLFLEEWAEDSVDDNPKDEQLEAQASAFQAVEQEKDCGVCGGSGPCSACDRGRALAKEQGHVYRRKKK